MKSTTIAVDLAKNVFQVAVSYHPGNREDADLGRIEPTRGPLLPFFSKIG